MKRNIKDKQREHFVHDYENIQRDIPDLHYSYLQCRICHKVIYPIPEYQKLVDYSKSHQFMFIHDWALTLLYVQPMPMVGITSYVKQLFLVLVEFAPEHHIPTENPGFIAYKYGPYADRVVDVILGLIEARLIETKGRRGTVGEYFLLTSIGKEIASKSCNKLTEHQKKELSDLRLDWHQMGTTGLINYIYRKYPDYAAESEIIDRVLRERRMGRISEVGEED
jgi:hypothetical protein